MTASTAPIDVFVIGGGVNGTGIARDAIGRGYSVMLAEMNDLASGTSSAATKLVHGGLRYLEYYEFRLVREALIEREVLWASAPHIIWPLRFILPHHKGLRPAWLLRTGLFIYDYLGGRKLLPATRTLDLSTDPAGKPLKPGYTTAFEYSDGWVDDARLVTLNARDAADRGATVLTRTKVVSARRDGGLWTIELEDQRDKSRQTVISRLLVNAGGPWVDQVIVQAMGRNDAHHVRLVKGSHIVVKKLFDHPKCYFFQNPDGRIIFAIPYEGDYTLIGTTDQDFAEDPATVKISDGEIDYLCSAASEYFAKPVTRDDIVWTYSGVRPLFDDHASAAQEATRDYVLKTEGEGDGPLINIFGGKLTTHRRLSEQVVDKIEGLIGAKGPRWTAKGTLPGGDFPATGFETLLEGCVKRYPKLSPVLLRRLTRCYGTKVPVLLGDRKTPAELGMFFGGTLYEAEVEYLIAHEWAMTADDVLWRRTKQGLRLNGEEKARLAGFMAARVGGNVQ
ncbi:glycerol-3-phosphate dehydrogenase [Devosia sp.]|uniref:glycerol-3-phosphate dehydrogenase n=1 Tax=Devosia sp. TaxID=1871048 RepID=UPI003BACC8E6